MTYDDCRWHRGDGFPADLAPDAAATHTGMFLAWALLAGLGGDHHVVESAEDFERLCARELTPGQYFLVICDGRFTDEDLNEEGNDFAKLKPVLDRRLHNWRRGRPEEAPPRGV